MKTFAHGSENRSVKRKKISRKGERSDAHVREMVSRYSDDEISEMNEANHSRISAKHIDVTGRSIFRSIQNRFFVQAKLEISQPGDASEVQADELASSVMDGDHEKSNSVLSRQPSMISPQSAGSGMETTSEFDTQLQSSKGSGQKLDGETRSEFEAHTGSDLSGVNIHTGPQASQMSESINAKAFTHGSDIYFKSGEYNPQSSTGKELLAHEVAHTVQQTGGSVQPKIQRFEAWEHEAMGNQAYGSSQANILLGPGLYVTFGQLTALAGDYFESIEDMLAIASKKGSDPADLYYDKPGTQDEIRYIVEYHIEGRDQNPALLLFYSQEVRDAADNRGLKLLTTNWDHFSDNLSAGDQQGSYMQKLNAPSIEGKLPNNEKAYRHYHEKAIAIAYSSGLNQNPIDAAMIFEGFASHFLTDAFAAGHVRTETRKIQEHWNAIYPMFIINLKGWLLEHLAGGAPDKMGIKQDRTWYGILEWATEDLLATMAFSFGDLISGVLHDYDNAKGLKVKTGKEEIEIYGDKAIINAASGKLAEPGTNERATFDAAANTLKDSIGDVRLAYQLGMMKTSFSDLQALYSTIKANEPLYIAEQKWPAALDVQTEERKQLNWKVSSLDDLFADPRMAKGITDYSNLRVLPAVKAAKEGLDETKKEIAGSGLEAIADKLQGDEPYIQDTLSEIINYYPGSITDMGGRKGRRSADNAYDYYQRAIEKGATVTLTPQQRAGLIQSCLDDPNHYEKDTGNYERNDQLIINILSSAPGAGVFKTIQLLDEKMEPASGWRKIVDFLKDEELDAFIDYLGPRYWMYASVNEKSVEWNRLNANQKEKKNVREMRIMMIILQNSEQSLNNDLKIDKGMESPIFNLSYEDFITQLDKTIKEEGEGIFQTHYTNFCGKVSLTRLWIKVAPNDYRRFMTELYYTGQARIGDEVFETPQSVIDAANKKLFKSDPEQKVMYEEERGKNVGDLIAFMDMVFYLTLASRIANFPVSLGGDYDPDKCKENKPWAGAAMAPETRLMEKLGFEFDRVGDSFRGVTAGHFMKLLMAAKQRQPVFLLVHSHMLDNVSDNKLDRTGEKMKHKAIGTHWIAIVRIDSGSNDIYFWEYASEHKVKLKDIKPTIAGGIIVEGYKGNKILLDVSGKKANVE